MDFRLNEDQEALQDGVRSFCSARVPHDVLHELAAGEGFDRALWRELAEMGVFNLCLAENEGGVGLGMADAVVVFAEMGRVLVPGPLIWTHLASGFIDGAATGETVVGGLDLYSVDQAPYVIEHLDQLDVILLLRREGVFRIDPREISARAIPDPLDPLTPVHECSELPKGERVLDRDDAMQFRLEASVLAAALQFGIAEACQELAVDYAKTREQFDRPIGSFQALKHILADMFVRQEIARAAAYAAGATLDDPGVGDVLRAASSAKLNAGDAAHKNARACIQVHGGMGYTWEVPAHYYLKRAWVLENSFGSIDEHAEQMASLIS